VNIEYYTRTFLRLQGKTRISDKMVNARMAIWWRNKRIKERGGLRLTYEGYTYLNETLDLESYDLPIPPDLDLKAVVLIFLDRNIQAPYYMTKFWLTLFSEEDALIMHLFFSDASKYGLSVAMNRRLKTVIDPKLAKKMIKPRNKKSSGKVGRRKWKHF
jgi:hypothetical protein